MSRQVDDRAKPSIRLFRKTDANFKFYYIGSFQFPGTMDFKKGVSFMIFVSKQDEERMYIGPIREDKKDEVARLQRINGTRTLFGKICVDLHSFTDGEGNIGYVGEALCPAFIDTTEGIFFTIFLSREGSEELQISRLEHRKKRLQSDMEDSNIDNRLEDEDDDYDEDDYGGGGNIDSPPGLG